MSSNRMVLVVLEVADLERSRGLYVDGFGIDLHASLHDDTDRSIGGVDAAYSWTDGAYLHFALYQAKGHERTTGAQLGLAVDDIDVAHAIAVAAGAEVVHAPRPEPWGPTARYRDFDGNVISLTQQS